LSLAWVLAHGKEGKKRRESNGKGNEGRREYERVFETFFESICCYGLVITDGNLQKADSTDLMSRQDAAQIAKEEAETQLQL